MLSRLAVRAAGAAQDGGVPLTWNEAASGICGSISMTCWFFLMVPQLIENYKQQSADAISLGFLFIWFVGDAANLVGAVLANLVPVVVAVAFYFFLSDFVFVGQCLYYKAKAAKAGGSAALPGLANGGSEEEDDSSAIESDPTTPLLSRDPLDVSPDEETRRRHRRPSHVDVAIMSTIEASEPANPWLQNSLVVLAICAVGAAGWAAAWQSGMWRPTPVAPPPPASRETSLGAAMLGYLSSVCYLGARLPQIYKNHVHKSCEGLSLLFFVMSVLGNVTYGCGILFHSLDRTYLATSLPWLIGSLGTIAEDFIIFGQFRVYAVQATQRRLPGGAA
ncbi:hypothetical protein KEM52_005499 [Ascosphaera acerosa]|nr:hypothetical protein KEM52_005499 [Ascosphaera acerosa]